MRSSPPSYDFFAAAAYHRRLSMVFYRLFLVAVLFQAFLLLLVCLCVTWFLTGDVNLSYWLMCLVVLAAYVAFGLYLGKRRAALGGVGIAKSMGAVRLFVSGVSETDAETKQAEAVYYPTFIRAPSISALPSSYARYYEFATQMSIASGVPLPKLYVLVQEMGVNAFVAGFDEKDTVLVLTQGAVEKLDNEALYGLIGHEFGHIIQGDARLNLTTSTLMMGLSWLYESSEWLSDVIFGKFHANYHRTPKESLVLNQPQSKGEWLSYWQTHRTPTRQEIIAELRAAAMANFVFVMGILVLMRMVGVVGMAVHDWIIHHFNRQRELLADATSIQLSRSFGVLRLLEYIEAGQSTQLTGQYSTYVGYFFFADPKMHEGFFSTHPEIYERLVAIRGRWYDDFGKDMTAHLDAYRLEEAHHEVCQHEAVTPLEAENVYQTLAFEAIEERVVDGRLVMDEAWYDWRAIDEEEKPVPKDGWIFTGGQVGVNVQAKGGGVSGAAFGADDDVLLAETFKEELPWILVKHERQAVGVVALIEAVLLCRFASLRYGAVVDLSEIYVQLSSNDETQKVQILPHSLDESLLEAVANLPRQGDGLRLLRYLKILNFHIKNPNISLSSRQKATLMCYQKGLSMLFVSPSFSGSFLPVRDYARLLSKMDKLWQACVLAGLVRTLSDVSAELTVGGREDFGRILSFLLPRVYHELPDVQKVGVVLLAFLVGVQDNSLLMGRLQAVREALVRWGRLFGVSLEALTEAECLNLIENTHRLSVSDWASVILGLNGDAKSVLLALDTAFLYDGKQSQKETDILAMLSWLWQR
ncbi:MAG: M48 family metalloprotease [Moraxella sp.]|nr:M48 family metalloprotease [Moraxella sp.]